MAVPVAAPPAPTVVVKQSEPVRPYTGTSSYKAYKEYFERICVCNDWKTPTERARHLLVAMDGAAPEAVPGLKAEQDSDLALIWEALARRFGFVDEPERAMRRFDVRKQLEGETLAVFEQSLRMLHGEAWPKTDIKSPEADSLLRWKFVDGILDMELQRHLRVHAAKDDFATTVSKSRQFLDASELTRTVKKPAIRATSPSVNYQSIVDGVMEALERDRGRMAVINTAQASNSNASSKKTTPRQGSPAPSNASTGRTVRFQDHEDARPSNQAYGSSARSRWQSSQPSQGNNNGSRPWGDRCQQGQASPRPQASGSGWMQRQGGPRFPPPEPGGSWTQGQGGPRFRPPAPGNTGNWRPGWRSSSGDRGEQQPAQQQYSSGQRRWSQGSADQQPAATVNIPPPRRRGCYVCGQPGCHADFHGPGAVSP